MSGAHGVMFSQNNYIAPTRTAVNVTISADTQNYVLNTAKAAGYTAGMTDVTLTINSGVYVGSTSTGTVAFDVDTSWHANDTVTVVNNGFIVGAGGQACYSDGSNIYPGQPGGPALRARRVVFINNTGTIGGGGGGGGAGGLVMSTSYGGGGGQGYTGGGTSYGGGIVPGTAGTKTNAGAAGGGYGGAGGTLGAAGASGSGDVFWAGGAGGNCTTSGSNALITWLSTGTRLGTIA